MAMEQWNKFQIKFVKQNGTQLRIITFRPLNLCGQKHMLFIQFLLMLMLMLMQAEHVNTFRKFLNSDMDSLVLIIIIIIIPSISRHFRSVSVLVFHLSLGQPPILLHLSNSFKVMHTLCVQKTLTRLCVWIIQLERKCFVPCVMCNIKYE